MKCSWLMNTVAALLFTSTGLAQAAVLTGGTGPGGVGLSDGSSTLEMWYKADALGLTNGASVANWTDSSGNGKTATQGTGANQPTFTTGVSGFNGRPVVRFDGANDSLPNGSYLFTGNESAFFVHAPDENGTGGRGLLSAASDQRGWGIDAHVGAGVNAEDDRYWVSKSIGPGTHTFSRQWGLNGAILNDLVDLGPYVGYVGTPPRVAPAQIAYGQTNPRTGTLSLSLGGGFGSALTYDGDYAEAIVFSNTVNTAQRSIVENYLSSKYDITLTAGEHYAGDTGGNGDYDQGVFGIGRVDASNQQLTGGSEGFGFEATALTDDRWLLAGNNNLTSLSLSRWNRAWYLQGTNLTGSETLNLAFDWSDANVGSFHSWFGSLMYSPTNGGPFTAIATGTYTGDRLNFTGLSSSLLANGYYTIGNASVPEPSSLVMLAFGMIGMLRIARNRRV